MKQCNGCDRPSEPVVQAVESGQPDNGNQNLVRTEGLENDLKCMAMMVANQRVSPRVGCHILVTPLMCRPHFSNSTNVQAVGFQGAVQFSETIQRRFWHGLPGGSVDDTHKFKKSSVWPTSGSNSREKTVLEWCPVF